MVNFFTFWPFEWWGILFKFSWWTLCNQWRITTISDPKNGDSPVLLCRGVPTPLYKRNKEFSLGVSLKSRHRHYPSSWQLHEPLLRRIVPRLIVIYKLKITFSGLTRIGISILEAVLQAAVEAGLGTLHTASLVDSDSRGSKLFFLSDPDSYHCLTFPQWK